MKSAKTTNLLIISLLLTSALMSLFFLGDALFIFPLVPYDVFAWLTRVLPGTVITFGIDRMVATLTFLGFNVADTAKTAERMMAVGITFTALTAWLTISLSFMKRGGEKGFIASILSGLIVGMGFTAVHLSLPFSLTDSRILAGIWIGGLFILWSAAGFWVAQRLSFESNDIEKNKNVFSITEIDRRKFLIRFAETTAAITVVGAGLSFFVKKETGDFPTAQTTLVPISITNLPEDAPAPGTRSEITPVDQHYVIDINPRPPMIDGDSYRLRVHGLVENELNLSLDQIKGDYKTLNQVVTLSCISNPVGGPLIGTTKWTGSSFHEILESAGLKGAAKYLEIRSIDGYHETVALELIPADERIMLAYAWDDQPLTHEHGYPLRIWLPDRYGMKQPRWITEIEAIDVERPGYWVERGWDKEAVVKSTAVIDTISDPIQDETGTVFVPIGGIAYAGARQISLVEIKIDDGAWVEADLFKPLSETAWVVWRFDWVYIPGDHLFEVRCYEGDGTAQIEGQSTPHPSGATGYHTVKEGV